MGLMDDIDRKMRQERQSRLKVQKKDRLGKQSVGIYCLPILETENTMIRCLYCGHPIMEIRNRVLYVSAYPAASNKRMVHDTIRCKDCRQEYTKIV